MRFKARLLTFWESVLASYWFWPAAMSSGALLLSFLMVWIDSSIPDNVLKEFTWLYTGTAGGARTILATIASSMIGLAGVVFSITIVGLTLASGQFGSRLLRNFMRDLGNQITLGTFLAAFLYCMMILRAVHDSSDEDGISFVPQLSMLVAAFMAVAGLGVLIYFIHHTAASIQATNVIAAVSNELFHAIQSLYPQKMGRTPVAEGSDEKVADAQIPDSFLANSSEVRAAKEGYVLRIEADQLFEITQAHDLVICIEHRPGQFVQRDDVILRVWPRSRATPAVLDALPETFAIGNQRSLAQDAEFAIEQLVEVATRALSPGINDPFTAIQCVDRLGANLSELARCYIPSPYRMDDSGHLRVVAYRVTFAGFLDTSFNQIRQYAQNSLDVLLRMLESLERVAHTTCRTEDRACIEEHGQMIYEQCLKAATVDRDRRNVESRYQTFRQKLQCRT